jgi:2-polyprenyl-3-methyl-5-hydroxy-6-metoxy-1,4-benzoquinol methylase
MWYEKLILQSVPAGCKTALDAGCGNGGLTRLLRDSGIPEVTGIDRNRPCVERCRANPEAGGISYVEGDVLTAPLEPADLVTSVASLHHMVPRAGLTRLRELVRPGGALVVIGLARPDLPKDIPIELVALAVNLFRRAPKTPAAIRPPIIWPPADRYATMRALATEMLPGVRWRRHVRWRYSLVWTNPG